jgi:hypothetical protein
VNTRDTSPFALPAHLAAKADPGLVANDERHLRAVAETIHRQRSETTERLADLRRQPRGSGEYALERDANIRRLSSRLRLLERFGADLTLGRMVPEDRGEPVYIGRAGLMDEDGNRLLVDWRSPAAEPFFAATHADPRGLVSRRRYRWARGTITDYWDEVFTAEGLAHHAALDDQSAFIASLGDRRTGRMQDVLATIQADQDAVIRAGSRGALVVDGGPGTGKTVVALHRTAHLLYADPRLRAHRERPGHRSGVLFVGPHEPYLAYVADVLPSLGEEGVLTCTLRALVPEGATAPEEADPEVVRLKSTLAMVDAVEPAVQLYEEPPTEGLLVETAWDDVWLGSADWAEAFTAREPGVSHNDAREAVWAALVGMAVARHGPVEGDDKLLHQSLSTHRELRDVFARHWPLLRPEDIVGDLYSVPAYLRRCAPMLRPEEVRALQREDPQAWTVSDLPVLDEARRRIGDPDAARRERRRDAALAADRRVMDEVIDDLVAADDSDLGEVRSLRTADIRDKLDDDSGLAAQDPDPLAGPFEHLVVDEAQELTDAQWRMLRARCPSGSFTIVGDRAQARHGFTESWEDRLERVGFREVHRSTLGVNYRTPQEVMAEAEPVIRSVIPDANVPVSVRSTGVPVHHGPTAGLRAVLADWLAAHHQGEGVAVVIGDPGFTGVPGTDRVRSLSPALAKGLEFDLVVLVDPDRFGTGIEGAVDRYVAMTRATQRLAVLTTD